jgi:hypothetical protein
MAQQSHGLDTPTFLALLSQDSARRSISVLPDGLIVLSISSRNVDMLYCRHMAEKNIKSILEHVDEWPHEAQEELMRSVTEIETRYRKIYHVSDDERAALERSAEDVRDGRFASDKQVAEVFGQHRRA